MLLSAHIACASTKVLSRWHTPPTSLSQELPSYEQHLTEVVNLSCTPLTANGISTWLTSPTSQPLLELPTSQPNPWRSQTLTVSCTPLTANGISTWLTSPTSQPLLGLPQLPLSRWHTPPTSLSQELPSYEQHLTEVVNLSCTPLTANGILTWLMSPTSHPLLELHQRGTAQLLLKDCNCTLQHVNDCGEFLLLVVSNLSCSFQVSLISCN